MRDKQPDLFDVAPDRAFGGATYEPSRDFVRLSGQLERVYTLMMDGLWRTLGQIAKAVGGSEAGVSARLRDLRKDKFGGHIVEAQHFQGGLWRYRVLPRKNPARD